MTFEDSIKEVYSKTVSSTHPFKMTIQSIIVIVMDFERVCTTARAFATAHGLVFVPFTLLQYEALIDRATHTAYVLTVAGGAVPADPDPFVENLAAVHDDQSIADFTS